MDKNLEKLLIFIDPVRDYRMLEFNEFKSLFADLTISLKDMEELEEEIRVLDLLNHYRFKTLPKSIQNKCKTAKIKDFAVIKGKGTDLRFVTFTLDEKSFEIISDYFRAYDRTYRRYKVEFSKAERSLLWKLKNTNKVLSDHRNEVDTRESIDLNGITRELPEYKEFENPKQQKLTEYEVRMEANKRRRAKRAQKNKLTVLKNRWRLLGMPNMKTICKEKEVKKPDTEFLKNSVEVKQGGIVYNGLGEFKRAG